MTEEGERNEHPGTWSGVLGYAAAGALGVGGAAALVDLWQIALSAPGDLPRAALPVVLALYLVPTFLLALLALAVVRLRAAPLGRAVVVVQALLVAAWAFCLAGAALQRAPLSSGRTAMVLAATVGAVAILRRRRLGAIATMALWALVVVGAYGAVHGFRPAPRPAPEPPTRPAATAEGRPNILLVVVDSLRADHLSCYGYPQPTTPVMDRLAAEGVRFARAFAQSSWAKPSTASLLTATYPSMHQANAEDARLSAAAVLLPEVLRAQGYSTAVLSANPWVSPHYGFDQGVDHFYTPSEERFARSALVMTVLGQASTSGRDFAKRLAEPEVPMTARDRLLAAEAARWLADRPPGPFFLYVHLMSPHYPYDPPPPFARALASDPETLPMTDSPHESRLFVTQRDALAAEKVAAMVGRYDADVRYVDTIVENFLDVLSSLELLDDTIIVITADHGEEFLEHGSWGHGHSLYNEVLHVPLLVRYPARLPSGRRVDAPVMLVDLMPSVLELAAIPAPAGIAGASFVALAQGTAPESPGEAYAELLHRYGTGRALVRGGKKLLEITVGEDRRREMYDLAADPDERWNLVNEMPEGPLYAARLAEVQSWAERHRAGAETPGVAEVSVQ